MNQPGASNHTYHFGCHLILGIEQMWRVPLATSIEVHYNSQWKSNSLSYYTHSRAAAAAAAQCRIFWAVIKDVVVIFNCLKESCTTKGVKLCSFPENGPFCMLQIIHANLHRWWVIEDICQKAAWTAAV